MTTTVRMTGALDPRDGWTAGASCTIAKSVELLSTRSAFMLMREAFYGATRFEEFVRRAELTEPPPPHGCTSSSSTGFSSSSPTRSPGSAPASATA